MIGLKNQKETLVLLRKTGAASATNDIDSFCVPWNGVIKAVYAVYGVMGTDGTGAPTQDVIADIKKNGTSIFSGATKINWTHANQLGTANTPIAADNYGALTTNPTSVSKGDFLRLDVTQILNGTNPAQPTDLSVYVVITRKPESAPAAMLTGQVDAND